VPTLEHRRFSEFCDACRRYAYIGLCYGAPGVGKTLSAVSYSRWEQVLEPDRLGAEPTQLPTLDTVFYTPSVLNGPNGIDVDIKRLRVTLRTLATRPLRQEMAERLESIRKRDEDYDTRYWKNAVGRPGLPELQPTYGDVAREYTAKELQIPDPTTLILVDEADRLRIASLEQIRAIFDAGEIGVILIGMPGLEKRLARYPQFYSRIGFVHEFRPLAAREIRELLDRHWTPPGVHLPDHPFDPETASAIIRITGGNFRLLNRLLTQAERILEINSLKQLNKAVVEAARESLVIGQA
jgi:hypothetical protein